jgi:Tol biopolymer transport system component
MFNSLKRKNDDKAKGRPARRWARDLLALGIVALVMSGAVLWLTRPLVPYSQFPTAHLQYDSEDGRQILNLQTGERTRVVIPIATPAAMTDFERTAAVSRNYSLNRSPDGAWIAYWEMVTESYEWRLMYKSATGDYTRDLGVFYGGLSRLGWTADSQWIIYSAFPEAVTPETFTQQRAELWMIHFETGEIKRLTNNDFDEADPSVSPDGTQIAYTSNADGYNRLYIMDIATGEVRLLTPDLHGYRATWSPDGRWIAFMTTSFDGSGDIWIIRADGTGAQAITTGPSRDDNPAWVKE